MREEFLDKRFDQSTHPHPILIAAGETGVQSMELNSMAEEGDRDKYNG